MADRQNRAAELRDDLVEAAAGVTVEVVGRLVQQQHLRFGEQLRHQPEQHRLAAGQGVQGAIQLGWQIGQIVQAQPPQQRDRALLDVPRSADDLEIALLGDAGFDAVQRRADLGDAQDRVDALPRSQTEILPQIAQPPRDGDRAAHGREFARDQP